MAKQRHEAKRVESAPLVTEVAREVSATTFGIVPGEEGRWLAVRVRNFAGNVYQHVLTPKRHGKDLGESKHLAVGRVLEAFQEFSMGHAS